MKIRFSAAQTYNPNPAEEYADVYAEFDVAEAPSEEQIDAVQIEINDSHDEWYESVICEETSYYRLCRDVCIKHGIKIVENPLEYTFYI